MALLSYPVVAREVDYVDTAAPPADELSFAGQPVDNIYVYDRDGRRLEDVRLFDAQGRSLVLQRTSDPMNPDVTLPGVSDVYGQWWTNVYPRAWTVGGAPYAGSPEADPRHRRHRPPPRVGRRQRPPDGAPPPTLPAMTFDVAGDAYQRFMGVYSDPLSVLFADRAGVSAGSGAHVVDVGCGTGALTSVLVDRLGPARVVGLDPSGPFVAAARQRLPDVDVRVAAAERLPLVDGSVDAALAQLVVQFTADPAAGLAEMARVTRPGCVVAACVWDLAGGRAPLSTFWRAAVDVEPATHTESGLAGVAEGDLVRLLTEAGLRDVAGGTLSVRRHYAFFDDWWQPYTLGVGPAGDHVRRLDDVGRERLRGRCRELLPERDIEVEAVAWVATGVVP